MVLVLGIVKTSLEKLGIGIGVKKVVLLMSAPHLGPDPPILIAQVPIRLLDIEDIDFLP